MKKIIILIFVISLFSCKKEGEFVESKEVYTTFILVRHAESTGVGGNPVLSMAGKTRAENLKGLMKNKKMSAVFSTNYNRTKETAQPTATDKNLSVQIYNPFQLEEFVDSTLVNYNGKTVLVVGHSNTTPELANILKGDTAYSTFPETEYDNIFTVTVIEKGRVGVLEGKY